MEGKTWVVLLLVVLLLIVSVDTNRRLQTQGSSGVFRSKNFTITYENIPALTVRRLAEGMESAYQKLVVQHGFREGSRSWSWKWEGDVTAKSPYCDRSIAAHEYFHSIQLLGYSLKLADRFLIEGTAMWAMREVFPRDVECYIHLLGDWLVGGTDVGSLKLLYRGHQAGLFWNFISDRYGGAQLIRQVFEHPDIRLGIDWPKVLSQLTGKAFLDLWAEFAVALAARQVPDAKWLYPRAEQKTPYVPVPVFVGEWTGQSLTIEQSNWENPYPKLPRTNKWEVGAPLTVLHPYGIHFLRIVPSSESPFILRFQGDPDTDFRVHIVAQKLSGAYEISPLIRECVIARPLDYILFQIVVTRGENGSGRYQLSLQKPQTTDFLLCHAVTAQQ